MTHKRLPLLLLIIVISISCKQELTNTKLNGPIFGTFYEVTYASDTDKNYQKSVDSIFAVINQSMSNYQEDSDISKVNRHEQERVDAHFVEVFKASKKIYNETNGVFDPTIGKLVNAWNFGSEQNKTKLDSLKIDSLMQYVGFEKIVLKNNSLIKTTATRGKFDPTIGAVVNAWDFGPEGKIEALDSLKIHELMLSVGMDKVTLSKGVISKPKATRLDFNAIAKGYGVDVIGRYLEAKNIQNYLIEIGGEIRTKGINSVKNTQWKVGVQHPNLESDKRYITTLALENESMATSGTYRKIKFDAEGNRYTHIIDTQTGYPIRSNILTVSVIAQSCMIADAYATAIQAMKVEEISVFLKMHMELKVFIAFVTEDNQLETEVFNGFPEN